MRIKTVAMIGAGNVGAYIVRGFAKKLQAGGLDGLWIIAEGARKERLERDGLSVPCAETIYHLLCALEEKNEGRFNY